MHGQADYQLLLSDILSSFVYLLKLAMCDLGAGLAVTYTSWACSNGIPSAAICSGSTALWTGVTCSSGTVTAITLFNLGLTGTISTSLGTLTTLTSLRLGTNCIAGTIPTEIGLLSSLSYLGLGINQFTSTIPTLLGRLTKLDSLFFNFNSLTGSVPSTLCLMNSLSNFGFSYCRIGCYASCLSTVATLSTGTASKCTSSPTTGRLIIFIIIIIYISNFLLLFVSLHSSHFRYLKTLSIIASLNIDIYVLIDCSTVYCCSYYLHPYFPAHYSTYDFPQ